jgi:hypothetical protein
MAERDISLQDDTDPIKLIATFGWNDDQLHVIARPILDRGGPTERFGELPKRTRGSLESLILKWKRDHNNEKVEERFAQKLVRLMERYLLDAYNDGELVFVDRRWRSRSEMLAEAVVGQGGD